MKKFLVKGKEKIDAIQLEDAIEGTNAVVAKKRVDLTEDVRLAKKSLRDAENITELQGFDAGAWVEGRLNATVSLALAKSELANFNTIFSPEDYTNTED